MRVPAVPPLREAGEETGCPYPPAGHWRGRCTHRSYRKCTGPNAPRNGSGAAGGHCCRVFHPGEKLEEFSERNQNGGVILTKLNGGQLLWNCLHQFKL